MAKLKWVFFILLLIPGYFLGKYIIDNLPILPLKYNKALYNSLGVHKMNLIGFLPYWLLNDASADYSPYLTNITYFGLAVSGDGSISQLNSDNTAEPGFHTFESENLKQYLQSAKNKGLEISLLLYAADTNSIDNLIKNPQFSAKNLISTVIPLMKQSGFTDLNIDLETLRVATSDEQKAFTQFLTIISQNLKLNNFSLTICLPVPAFSYSTIIDPLQIQPLVDRMVLMTYDYYYRSSSVTGPNAPLDEVDSVLNSALTTFRPEQIILGIPLYNYQWETLKNTPGSPILPGSGETLTQKELVSLLTNCPQCQFINHNQSQETTIIYPDATASSYHQTFVPSENNFIDKINLAKKYHLGGVAFWALGYESEKYLSPFSTLKSYFWLN